MPYPVGIDHSIFNIEFCGKQFRLISQIFFRYEFIFKGQAFGHYDFIRIPHGAVQRRRQLGRHTPVYQIIYLFISISNNLFVKYYDIGHMTNLPSILACHQLISSSFSFPKFTAYFCFETLEWLTANEISRNYESRFSMILMNFLNHFLTY